MIKISHRRIQNRTVPSNKYLHADPVCLITCILPCVEPFIYDTTTYMYKCKIFSPNNSKYPLQYNASICCKQCHDIFTSLAFHKDYHYIQNIFVPHLDIHSPHTQLQFRMVSEIQNQ